MNGASGEFSAETIRDENRRDELLQLALLPGIGPRTLTALLAHFGTPGAVLRADPGQLSVVPGVGRRVVTTIRTATDYVDVQAVIAWCDNNDVAIVTAGDADYPSSLHQLCDAPPVLFRRGDWCDRDRLAVSIVGTRHASADGRKHAEHFASMLARTGITVVSGLARGIDAAAHQGAIDAGGRTLAVLGSGMACLYPPEHDGLADTISGQGAVISEYAPHAKPRSGMFPQRNRLIAALGLACLVVEAPQRSGALITARLAMEQNKEVMAIPGPISRRSSQGCNQLIRDGATLVQNIDDILQELGPLSEPVAADNGGHIHRAAELTLNELEQQVLAAIDSTSTLLDQVIGETGLPAQQVLAVVSVLEMKRLVRRQSGQYVVRR